MEKEKAPAGETATVEARRFGFARKHLAEARPAL
jgi:hypothetical protein